MIICPQCGASNGDDVKFCDRCGQGLAGATARAATATALSPLAEGTELKGGLRVIELTGKTAHENRYRAERLSPEGKIEHLQLREQIGPAPDDLEDSARSDEAAQTNGGGAASVQAEDDPAGPRAKTADLKLKVVAGAAPSTSAPGRDTNGTDDTGGLATVASESDAGVETDTGAGREVIESRSATNGSADSAMRTDEAVILSPAEAEESNGASSAPEVESIIADRSDGPTATAPEPPQAATPVTLASVEPAAAQDDLGEVFGRVMALSMTQNHPAFQRALDGFAENGRVYLVYRDEQLTPLSRRKGGLRMSEADAIAVAIQVCQAVAFVNRRGLRVNDICPDSVAFGADGRIRLTGLDCISNDNELQAEPLFNDG